MKADGYGEHIFSFWFLVLVVLLSLPLLAILRIWDWTRDVIVNRLPVNENID